MSQDNYTQKKNLEKTLRETEDKNKAKEIADEITKLNTEELLRLVNLPHSESVEKTTIPVSAKHHRPVVTLGQPSSTAPRKSHKFFKSCFLFFVVIVVACMMLIVANDKKEPNITKVIDHQKNNDSIINLPNGNIYNIWMEHNVMMNSHQGMNIHIKFDINDLYGVPCNIIVYFYSASGHALNDFDGLYGSANGQVIVDESFTPPYINTKHDDFVLFMPYLQLHAGKGSHKLTLKVSIEQQDGRLIALSHPVNFQLYNQ